LGYNYRLSDINCALGIVQLSRIEEMLKKREQASVLYDKYLSDCPDIILPSLKDKKVKRSWFVYVIRLNEEFSEEQRNKIITLLRGKGIGCSAYFPPIHLQSFYVDEFSYKAGVFPITEAVAARTIALPFFNLLTVRQIEHIAESLKNSIRKVK
jgi:perosamine synthetase